MTKSLPVIHFAHGNGFPGGSYSCLFEHLTNEFKILSIDIFGQDPAYPIVENWKNTHLELCDFIEKNSTEPVIGVGHSMGSLITLMACLERPELFKCIIMLDPPIVMGIPAILTRILKKLKLMDRVTPSGLSKNRRREWKSRDEAFAYFRSKDFFKNLDDQSLRNYVLHGTHIDEKGHALLKYPVQDEVRFFRTTPHHFSFDKFKLKRSGRVITGMDTDVSLDGMVSKLCRKYGMSHQTTKGGHLFPLEFPMETANIIRQSIRELGY